MVRESGLSLLRGAAVGGLSYAAFALRRMRARRMLGLFDRIGLVATVPLGTTLAIMRPNRSVTPAKVVA